MINDSLPHGELIKPLSKHIDRINYILGELGIGKQASIVDDKALLGRLHHALNIPRYGQPEFMEALLRRAGRQRLETFLGKIGLVDGEADIVDLGSFVKKAAHLPWGDNNHTRAFVNVFGYEDSLIPSGSVETPAQETCRTVGEPLDTLKDYQSGIFFRGMEQAMVSVVTVCNHDAYRSWKDTDCYGDTLPLPAIHERARLCPDRVAGRTG